MIPLHRLALSAAVLALAFGVAWPSAAGAEPEGRGKNRRGQSSEARGGQSGKREYSRSERTRSSSERGYAHRVHERERTIRRDHGSRERAVWRDSGSRGSGSRDRGTWRDRVVQRDPASRGQGSRDLADRRSSGSRGEVRYKGPREDHGADRRWRDSDGRSDAPLHQSWTDSRYEGPSYSRHHGRPYYTGSFHRPRYLYRSGFSLGIVIGSVPWYGYRYFDPYCDLEFRNLDIYYDHCYDHGHAETILVLDRRSDHPFASCIYRDGDWVIDDCY